MRQGLTAQVMTACPRSSSKSPLPRDLTRAQVLDREKFEQMKDEYYEIRGWDKETGIPTREKLVELGLEDVAEEVLEKAG